MKISDLRNISSMRTKGKWSVCEIQMYVDNCGPWYSTRADDKFIAIAANTYDLLLDVAEAAEELVKHSKEVGGMFWNGHSLTRADEALRALEAMPGEKT